MIHQCRGAAKILQIEMQEISIKHYWCWWNNQKHSNNGNNNNNTSNTNNNSNITNGDNLNPDNTCKSRLKICGNNGDHRYTSTDSATAI